MASPADPPLIGIVGWKGSGKTTLIGRLISALAKRGLAVATLKHTHHALRDHDGATDGERHARAGAVAVAVIGPEAWELDGVRQPAPPPSLEAAAARLRRADLVFVEGFKGASIPKIEVRGPGGGDLIDAVDPHVFAIASDAPVETAAVPVFARTGADGLALLIARRLAHLRR